jgi:hypothetical protein
MMLISREVKYGEMLSETVRKAAMVALTFCKRAHQFVETAEFKALFVHNETNFFHFRLHFLDGFTERITLWTTTNRHLTVRGAIHTTFDQNHFVYIQQSPQNRSLSPIDTKEVPALLATPQYSK